MTDKILAILSFVGLIAFTAVVIGFVKELDLAVVIIICLLVGIYDFWATFRSKGRDSAETR